MASTTAPLGEATRAAMGREGEPHVISLLVRDEPGALVRIALIFARRGYNIESLSVCPDASAPHLSRMTIVSSGDPATLEQIRRQLAKLVTVVHALDHTGQAVVEAEVALLKIRCGLRDRNEILQIAEHFEAKVVDFGAESVILRVHGGSEKLDAMVELVQPLGLVELVRSGKVLLARGLETT